MSLQLRLGAAFRARGLAPPEVLRYEFDESKHNRDHGQFATKPGGEGNSNTDEASDVPRHPPSVDLQPHFSAAEHALPAKVTHPHRTHEALFKAAAEVQPQLAKMLGAVAERLQGQAVAPQSHAEFLQTIGQPGASVILGPIKGEETAAKKVRAKYQGDYGKLSDAVRATIGVEHTGQIPAAIEALREHLEPHGFELAAAPEDRMSSALDEAGYRDVTLKLRHKPTGLVGELQINTKPMLQAKEGGGHQLYEQQRKISQRAAAENRELTPDEIDEQARLGAQAKTLYGDAWQRSGQPK